MHVCLLSLHLVFSSFMFHPSLLFLYIHFDITFQSTTLPRRTRATPNLHREVWLPGKSDANTELGHVRSLELQKEEHEVKVQSAHMQLMRLPPRHSGHELGWPRWLTRAHSKARCRERSKGPLGFSYQGRKHRWDSGR